MITKTESFTSYKKHIEQNFGKKGTPERDDFDKKTLKFQLGILFNKARRKAKLTQKEVADRTGTKPSLVAKLERGMADITLTKYRQLVEVGLKKELKVMIG